MRKYADGLFCFSPYCFLSYHAAKIEKEKEAATGWQRKLTLVIIRSASFSCPFTFPGYKIHINEDLEILLPNLKKNDYFQNNPKTLFTLKLYLIFIVRQEKDSFSFTARHTYGRYVFKFIHFGKFTYENTRFT